MPINDSDRNGVGSDTTPWTTGVAEGSEQAERVVLSSPSHRELLQPKTGFVAVVDQLHFVDDVHLFNHLDLFDWARGEQFIEGIRIDLRFLLGRL